MPSTCLESINQRLDFVEFFYNNPLLLEEVRQVLGKCKDLERCYQRIALNRSTGGPRDMQMIALTLSEVSLLKGILKTNPTKILTPFTTDLGEHGALVHELSKALNDNLPLRAADGNLIRSGYDKVLDSIRSGVDNYSSIKSTLQSQYRRETGKNTLKIMEGKLLGFYVEISKGDGLIDGNPKFVLDGQTDGKFRYRTGVKRPFL